MNFDEGRISSYITTHTIRYVNELELRIDILKERIAGLQDLSHSVPPSQLPRMKELETRYSDEIADLNLLLEEVRETW